MTRARIIIAFILAAALLASPTHAHTWRIPVPREAYTTERTPDPVVKVCTEERITTMAQARAAASITSCHRLR